MGSQEGKHRGMCGIELKFFLSRNFSDYVGSSLLMSPFSVGSFCIDTCITTDKLKWLYACAQKHRENKPN